MLADRGRLASWSVALASAGLLAGCGGGEPAASPAPTKVAVAELGFVFPVPGELSDVVYAIGDGPEGKPAAFLSSRSLRKAGGDTCGAGATGAVSPFPLGRVTVADEPPEKVALEIKDDPEDGLGEFLVAVGESYLYYTPAPDEACSGRPGVADLQRRQGAAVKVALRSALPTATP